MKRQIGVVALAVSAIVTLLCSTGAFADTPSFQVMNTSETPPDGVWFRNSPHTADTDRVTGLGVYANEWVQLICYDWGDSVGPYNDSLWYFTKNQTRPTVGSRENSGYLNAHYINDQKKANEVDAGVPQCGSSTSPATSGPAPTGPPISTGPTTPQTHPQPSRSTSVFFSPNDTPGALGDRQPADLNLRLSDWSSGSCDSSQAFAAAYMGGESVKTLSGWSKGRLGIVYFLTTASPSALNALHRIVLFDPGNSGDFAKPSGWSALLGQTTCDWHYAINEHLASWLSSNSANHLIVLTGLVSEEKDGNGKSTYAGLWHYYFAGIWNQPYADRAIVCDYDRMSHTDVLSKFASIVKSDAFACPGGISSWNP